ncbi:MAG TPA: MFS transporter [Acidimicrobiales bacterium]|nr:MFS transporter [Acidimicrobiales bacterium]
MSARLPAGRLAETWQSMRKVLAEPQLRRAELAFLLSCAADSAFTVTLSVVAFLDGGAAAVGLVGVIRMLPSAVGTPFFTALADRYRRERVLVAGSVVRGIAIVYAAAILEAGGPVPAIYALAVPATIASTVFRPAHSALLPSLCRTASQLTSANVVRGLLESLATLSGPALVGVLLGASDATVAFAATAGLSLGSAAALLGLRYEAPPRPAISQRPMLARDTAAGVQAVGRNHDLRLLFGLGFAQTFVRGALNVFVVIVALELLRTGESGAAALFAAVGAGGLLGSFGVALLVGSRRLGWWLAIALVLWGAPIAAVAAVPTMPVVLALLAVVGLGNAIIDVPLFTLPVRLAPDAVLARAFGVFESLVALGVALGSAVTPVLINLVGLRGALVATGLVLPVLAAVALRRLQSLDGRLQVRDAEIRVLRTTPMFALLPVPTIEHLASSLRRRRLPAGTVVFRQGDVADTFYFVDEGEAEVIGDGEVVATIAHGDSFGEIALLHDVPRTATVRARTDLSVLEIERHEFLDAVSGYRSSSDAASAIVARHLANFSPGTVRL